MTKVKKHKFLASIIMNTLLLATVAVPVLFNPTVAQAVTVPPFTHSHYVSNASSSTMYNLGYNESNTSGLIILDFGAPAKYSGSYGTYDFGNVFLYPSDITNAVNQYISGYTNNTSHTNHIRVAVGTSNYNLTNTYALSGSTDWNTAGNSIHSIANSVTRTSIIDTVEGAIDAEVAYNSSTNTRAFVDGFASNNVSNFLYNYGDDAGGTNPLPWTANDVWYVSYGASCSWAIPEIYTSGTVTNWQSLSLWAYTNKGYSIYFSGLMSENGANGHYTNSQAYTNFYNALNSDSRTAQSSLQYPTDI